MAYTTPYDSLFQDAASKYNVDYDLLRAVAKTESGYNANAVSSAGAVGVMQLMPATAQNYGVTNRYNAAQNIDGGAHMLSDLLDQYNGDISKTLAAYNTGPGTVASLGITNAGQTYIDAVMSNYEDISGSAYGSSSNTVELTSGGGFFSDLSETWDNFMTFFTEPMAEGGWLYLILKWVIIIGLVFLCLYFGNKAIGGNGTKVISEISLKDVKE